MNIKDTIRIEQYQKKINVLEDKVEILKSDYYREVTNDSKRKALELKLRAIK